MELRDLFRNQMNYIKRTSTRALDGLRNQELMWRPGPECNSIGLILLHVGRFEDSTIQTKVYGKPTLWESEKWYQKMNLAITDAGAHYTVQQVTGFTVPEPKDLLDYCGAVRIKTVDCLNSITLEDLDRKITDPRMGETTIGAVLAQNMIHLAMHAGDISYLRGIQRGMDK